MHSEDKKEMLLAYIDELKPYLLVSTLMLILSSIAGYIAYGLFPDYALGSLSGLEELAEMLRDMSAIQIMLLIFVNNAVKMFITILSGVIFGIVPLGFLILNGFVLGVFIHLQVIENGPLFIIAGLVPHGIIEIPMLLLTSAMGFKLGHQLMLLIIGKNVNLKDELVRDIKFFFHWVFPLVFIAAFIETFITPIFIYLVTGI
ncbi:stage II sporulation protein M [Methanolobus sp. ZRKC3]|uniref:stage II sporulation protein M n=1 Tax=Methanolobus sp. ZRKC3 TaxID=3125786 RepID=UPI0032466742